MHLSGKMIRVSIFAILAAAALAGAAIYITRHPSLIARVRRPQETAPPVSSAETDTEIVAENLAIPWEIVFLPDGDLLVTERPGTLKRIGNDHRAYAIKGVAHVGEGGLLGAALHPQFYDNHWVYLYLTTRTGDGLANRVERYRLENDRLAERTLIIEGIPGASNHDGGRIAFGPDGYLYITTGDAGSSRLAQDRDSLAGKILRLGDDGSVPADNHFGTAIWSYGHRNPQGLAWDDTGRLWATEHGRSIPFSGYDELNLIEKGKNYGWPTIQGNESGTGMERPMIHSGASDTWAPAGAAYRNGSIFFGGLRGEALYEVEIRSGEINLNTHLHNEFGRIRAVVAGPDGFLYISTSNTDGRGDPLPGDDKIIKYGKRN